MATIGSATLAKRSEAEVKDRSWIPLFVISVTLMSALMVAQRVYQGLYAWQYGRESSSPEFAKYWMSLFWFNLTVATIVFVVWAGYLLWTEPRETTRLAPREELKRLRILWTYIMALCVALYWAASFFGEQDAAWHQVVVRDTALTASHIVLFYFTFPGAIAFSILSYLYARTRLPHIYRDKGFPLSFGMVISGTILLMFEVAFNEWGHSFWIAEELFAVPFHWGFVIFGYLGGAIFAIWFQTYPRISELYKLAASGKAA